ncbi:MAG TPA: aspartate aminotransferase family protein [Alphaproteobacteria bacterium]|nr:aspartate aminotransferase family protein [Alphaproteobacteria bacterium]
MTTRANSAARRDIAYHLHPYTNAKKLEAEGPLILSSGKGVFVRDDEGRDYIEGLAGLWCVSLGWGEERLVEAATRQLRTLPYYHSFAQKVPEVVTELAEALVKLAPVPMSKAFFVNSGSEANDTVVKMVWYYNNALGRRNKKKIISRMRAYHGVTVAAASLAGLPLLHADFDLPIANILHADCPHHYRFAEPDESEEEFSTRLAENLEKLILKEGPDTIAAFIAEPVQGAGGVIVPPKTYFEKIQAVLRKYDVLFIADEVITGFGRTGNMFATETFGLKPDMITVAKALSSGYQPIAAVLLSEKIYQAIRENSDKNLSFGHGYTYSGHPVAAAVALETLKIYDERKILDHVRSVMGHFQRKLQSYGRHPLVGEARSIGLVGALELVADKRTKAPFAPPPKVALYAQARAQDHGLLLRAIGDSVAFCPPLVITEREIDEMFRRWEPALDETLTWVQAQGLMAA